MQRFSGTKLRERRKALGISREQLAVLVDRSHSSIKLYENGRTSPQAAVICRLADLLDCQIADLFEDDPAARDAVLVAVDGAPTLTPAQAAALRAAGLCRPKGVADAAA